MEEDFKVSFVGVLVASDVKNQKIYDSIWFLILQARYVM